MVFTMAVGLFTSRVNLQVLGVEDNGIYQVVGGVVTMFTFLSGSLSAATARFLTYELGSGNSNKLKSTFAALLNVHILVAFIVFILCETIGIWFVEYKLVIPEDKMMAARIVFQFSVLAAMLNITQVPYSASIISHERINVFAYMSIVDVCLKLLICYLLYIVNYDKLVAYSALLFVATFLMQLLYRMYCIRKFEECHFSRRMDFTLVRPILSFSGWNLFNSFSSMSRDQGSNMIMNIFFGPIMNSAIGFSNLIGTTVYGLANNFLTAIRQPIVKAYSINDINKMVELMTNASKIAFVLMILLSAPFFFESNYILQLWLKTPPEYTDIFCKIELFFNVLLSIFLPLIFAIHATGNIKFVSIVNGLLWLTVLPITYIMLKYTSLPIMPYVVKTSILLFVIVSYYISIKRVLPDVKLWVYTKKCVIPCVMVLVLFFAIFIPLHCIMGVPSYKRLLLTCLMTTVLISVLSYIIVLDSDNRRFFNSKFINILMIKNGE